MRRGDGEMTRQAPADGADRWEALGQRLRAARRAQQLSQETVARTLGVLRPAVSEMERGRRKVYATELAGMATLYRTSTALLLDEPVDTVALLGVDLDASDYESVVLFARFLLHQHRSRQE